jgi:hypothetical protein
MRGTPARRGEDLAVELLAEPLGELAAARRLAVVGVERSAAALGGGDRGRRELGCGPAHAREERPLEAAEQELRAALLPRAGVPA